MINLEPSNLIGVRQKMKIDITKIKNHHVT